MGIDAKDVQCFVWKIVRFSMNICYRFAQKHPFFSGVVLLFFLLYLFLPSVFFFLIYSSPLIICSTVFIRIYFQKNRYRTAKRVDEKSSVESKSVAAEAVVISNDDKPSFVSRRKNLKECDAEGGNKEKGLILDTAPVDASIVGNQKEITEEKGSSSEHGESSSRNIFYAENIQPKDDLVGKTNLNELKSQVVIGEKGSDSLHHGESSGKNASAAQIVKASPNEESSKGGTENKEIHYLHHGESCSRNVPSAESIQVPDQANPVLYSEPSMVDLILQKDLVEPSEKVTGGGGEDEEESSDEEEAQQNGNNAVEWTADDQQNLMDLGDSELERNKRLESLIARRRARKLFKIANEKRGIESGSGPGGQIPSISVTRNNILNIPNHPDMVEGLQVPGSAPSILLPTRNPFDIPYDPYEERPDLTDDSFNEEFSTPNPKELLFCRHESFFLGPSFSVESHQDHHDSHFCSYGIDRRTAQGLRFSRYRTISDMSAHDQLIDELLSTQEGELLSRNVSATDLVELGSQSPKQSTKSEESKHDMAGMKREEIDNSADRSEFQMETDSARDNSSEPCSLASDEASDLSFHVNISSNTGDLEPKVGKFRQKLSDRVQNSLTFTIPEGIALNGPASDSSPCACDKSRMEDRLFYRDKGPCHSPGYSIASDLQVEVSEVGSPPLPIDGTMSPADAESSYDGDIEKDITSGSEELWGASSHLSGVDENESKAREVNEVSEDDILEVGFSGIKKNLQNPVTSSTLPAQIAEQDMSNTSSLSSSRTEMPEKDKIHLKNPDNKLSQNGKQVEAHNSSNAADALPPKIPEKTLPVMKESVSHPPSEFSSKKPEELSNAPEKSAEVNASNKVDNQVVHTDYDKDNLQSTEGKGGGSQISTNRECLMDLSQPAEKITSEPSRDIEQDSDKPAEQQTMINSEKQMEENKNPEFNEGDPPYLNGRKEVGGTSMPNEAPNEQNTTEVGASGVNQSFDNPVMLAPPPTAFMAEQLSTNSSSCSSPRSVLPGKIQTDQIPPLSFHQQQIPNDIPQSVMNDIVGNNPLVEVSPESLILVTAPESSQHLEADKVDLPSTSSSFRESEETSAEVVESRSDPLIVLESAAALSASAGKTHPNSVDDIKEKSQTLPEHGEMSPSKIEEKVANSNALETMVKQEETPNSPGKPTGRTDKGSPGESHLSITMREIVNPPEPAEASASKVVEDNGAHQENLTENEASVDFDGHESSSTVKVSKDIIHEPKLGDSESKLEAVKDSQGEAKNAVENKAAAAATAVGKEQSNPLLQNSISEDGTMPNVNEAVPDDVDKKKSLIDQENVADQPEPRTAEADVDMKHIVKETVADEMSDQKSLIDQANVAEQQMSDKAKVEVDVKDGVNQVADELSYKESVADQPEPGKAAAKVDMKHNVKETLANEMSDKKSLINKQNVAEQPISEKGKLEVAIKDGLNQTVADEISNKENKNMADRPEPDKAATKVDIKHNVTEAVDNEMKDKTSLIDPIHASDQLKHDNKATEEVDMKRNVNEKDISEISGKKSLIDQENVADQLKPGTDDDNSLNAIEDDKREPNDLKKEDVKMDNLTNPNNIAEHSKPTESEVKESETITAA